jgi:hypothetical protein
MTHRSHRRSDRATEELFPGFRRKVPRANPTSSPRTDAGVRRTSMEGRTNLWRTGEVYRCPNPQCLSCILVLVGPEWLPGNPGPPACLCGTVLSKTVLGVEAPGAHDVPEVAVDGGEPCATGEDRE